MITSTNHGRLFSS